MSLLALPCFKERLTTGLQSKWKAESRSVSRVMCGVMLRAISNFTINSKSNFTHLRNKYMLINIRPVFYKCIHCANHSCWYSLNVSSDLQINQILMSAF